jgi:EmrB/QacA subfamily drug resistance transporter
MANDTTPAMPARETAAPNRPWVFAAALSATFMSAIEGTIVATAMPSIVASLGGFELFSWVFTSYLLAQAATIPVYGKLADLFGRKHVLFFGIGVFLAGSLLCGFAWSMPSLVAFRVLQGLGAGGVMPVSQTVVGDLYRGEERARMQGFISMTFGSAAILGPIVGAALVEHAGWPAVFWVNIPLGIVAVVMLAVMLKETVERRKVRIDYLGSLLMTLGTTSLMFALVQMTSVGWASLTALLLLAVLAFALLLAHERRTPEPILPPNLWRNRFVATGNANSGITGAIAMGIIGFLPAYVEGVLGQSAFVAGLTLMAVSAFWSVGGFVAGRMMLRWPYRAVAICGGVIVIGGSVMMTFLDPARGATWAIAGSLASGFGMGLANNCMVVAIQANATWSERGVATSSIVYTRIVGQAVGTAAFGGILNTALSAHFSGSSDIVDRMLVPALRATIPAAALAPLLADFARAVHYIYLINLGLAVVILLTLASLPRGAGLTRR